jgi:hypothetical protein
MEARAATLHTAAAALEGMFARMLSEQDLVTYLTDAAEPPPQVGEEVVLRILRGGAELEAFTPTGRRLGRVPPAECAALGEVTAGQERLPGHVAALVPRPGLTGPGRIHLRLYRA